MFFAVLTPRLKSLNISGPQGSFKNLSFLHQLPYLEELYVANTSWLDYNRLMPVLKEKGARTGGSNSFGGSGRLKVVDIAGGIKVDGTKQIDVNMNRGLISDFL